MRARNKMLLSAVMMTMLSSTVALPSTWAAAGLGSNGNVFAVGSESKFESTGDTTATGVIASNGGQVTIASLDTPDQNQLPKRHRQPAFITGMLDNSSIQVDGGIMDVTTAPWQSPYPVAFAYNSKINLGIDDAGTVKHKVFNMQGNVLVTDKTMPPYQQQQPSVINIGLGRAHNSPNQFTGKAVNTLEDKGGEINMTFDGGMWSHDNMGGLEAFQIKGNEARSSINTLKGTRTREGFSRISQDSRSDIHVNNLDGHINVIYDMSAGTGLNFAKPPAQKTGLDASDIEGGNFIVKSATAGSGVHGYVTGDQLDTSSESNVNKILDNLAHKFYYENYMNGERNLSGTVSIASNGIVSSFQKALTTDQKEGAITWQNGNGQGSYAAPTPTPTPAPTPETPVTPINLPSGNFTDISFRLFFLALLISIKFPLPSRRTVGTSIFFLPDKYAPVIDFLFFITSFGVPTATTSPPCSPAFGPISIIKSHANIVSSSCSTTNTVLPKSRIDNIVLISFSLSLW